MSRYKRKKFSCDFETTTDPNDCRVWGYGLMEIGNTNNFKIGNKLDEFMEWCKDIKADLYFHNLRFDGSFIVSWLLNNGYEHCDSGQENTFDTVISNMGQWYKITISYGYNKNGKKLHTTIYDSLKKLPFSLDRIGKAFKLTTKKIEVSQEFYNRYRPVGHNITSEEFDYIFHDIKVLAEALQIQFNQGLKKMTVGSDSLNNYKEIITRKQYNKLFPTFDLALNENIRKAYKGGFTWLNPKYKEKDIDGGIVFDVNSLYPYVLYDRDLPYGEPMPFAGEYENDELYPLHIQHIRCEFALKDNCIPTIQIKGDIRFKGNEYLETSKGEIVDLYLTNIDLKLIKEHYDLYDLQYIQGWKFKSKRDMFKQFIDKWTYVKVNNSGAIRELAKLMLNNLYGKFATNPDITKRIPYLKEDGVLRFVQGEEEYDKPNYTAIGVYTTSYAREKTIRTAQENYHRFIYADTDSIHLVGHNIPENLKNIIHDTKLGYWDFETSFTKGRYLRQKTYALDVCKKKNDEGKEVKATIDDYEYTKFEVTASGMKDNIRKKVNWDNFKIGFSSMGNLKSKQVKGGVVLYDSEFTIR